MKQKIIYTIIGLFIVIISIPTFIFGSRYISNIPIKNIHKKYSQELFIMRWDDVKIHLQIHDKWYFSQNFSEFNRRPHVNFKLIIGKERLKKHLGNDNFKEHGLYRIKLFNENEMLVKTYGFKKSINEVTVLEQEETVEYYYNYIQWSYSDFKDFPTMTFSFMERK